MSRALEGKKILVTREEKQAEAFSQKLKEVGAVPFHAPLLLFKSVDSEKNQRLFKELHEFTWVFFTSANGVKFFFELINTYNMDNSILNRLKIAVVGKKTEQALHTYGFKADFCPKHFQGTDMVIEFLDQYPSEHRIFYVCGNLSREDIPTELRRNLVFFRKVVLYDTLINEQSESLLLDYLEKPMDAYTFTSPSTVDAFLQLSCSIPRTVARIKENGLCVCIGSTTEKKAREEGFRHVLSPHQFTTEGMIELLLNYFNPKR